MTVRGRKGCEIKMIVAIIGGGASGLVAALAAAKNGAEVTIYERCDRVGKKILSTGNGRCNMTNINADVKNYHGNSVSFINGVKSRFWVDETLNFFEELGLLYKVEEEGRVYPYSDTATSVLDVLRNEVKRTGISVEENFEVKELKKYKNGFEIISYNGKSCYCERAIIATGGKAAPSLGSNGSGYDIARAVGHTVTQLYPSLVQLKTEGDTAKKLKGLRLQCGVSVNDAKTEGEILFTDYGLSGISVFDMSAYSKAGDILKLDIMPQYSYDDVYHMIDKRAKNMPDCEMENFFVGMLNKRVGQVFLKNIGIVPLSRKADTLTQKEIRNIANSLKAWKFDICGTMSWNNAQVTRGGINTDEVNPDTLESKKQKGLYFCGEILDIDGDCGGYNLQWAWSSGYIAGIESAK